MDNPNSEKELTNKDLFRGILDWVFGGKKEESNGEEKKASKEEGSKEVIDSTAEEVRT